MSTEKRLIDANALMSSLRESLNELRRIGDGLSHHEDKKICNGQICTFLEAIMRVREQPTVDAIPVKDLERILSTTPGLELWDYQKRGIMSAVNRLCGKEKNDG